MLQQYGRTHRKLHQSQIATSKAPVSLQQAEEVKWQDEESDQSPSETIVALSSGTGRSAVAVIRMSGPHSGSVSQLQHLCYYPSSTLSSLYLLRVPYRSFSVFMRCHRMPSSAGILPHWKDDVRSSRRLSDIYVWGANPRLSRTAKNTFEHLEELITMQHSVMPWLLFLCLLLFLRLLL